MNFYDILLIILIILLISFVICKNNKEHFDQIPKTGEINSVLQNKIMSNGEPINEPVKQISKHNEQLNNVLIKKIKTKTNTDWFNTNVSINEYIPISYKIQGDWKIKIKELDGWYYIFVFDSTYEKMSIDIDVDIIFINKKNVI